MINPGSTPGTAFSQSAQTRFNNTQINAARASMPFNMAAQQSLRNQTSSSNPSGPPVGSGSPVGSMQSPSSLELPMMEPAELPTGGPQMPVEAAQDFDPSVFIEQTLDNVVGQVTADRFFQSPQVKDALTRIKLKNMLNVDNPNATPDPRTTWQRVMQQVRTRED